MELKFQSSSPRDAFDEKEEEERDIFNDSDDDMPASESYADLAIKLTDRPQAEESKSRASVVASFPKPSSSKCGDENLAPSRNSENAAKTSIQESSDKKNLVKIPVPESKTASSKRTPSSEQASAAKPPCSSTKSLTRKALNQHLDAILAHKHRTWFERPVSDKQAPGYSRLIETCIYLLVRK